MLKFFVDLMSQSFPEVVCQKAFKADLLNLLHLRINIWQVTMLAREVYKDIFQTYIKASHDQTFSSFGKFNIDGVPGQRYCYPFVLSICH